MDKQYSYSKETNKDEEIILTIKVLPQKFNQVKDKVYNRLKDTVQIQGFRPGKAPKALIESRISSQVYDETINELIPEITESVLNDENITPFNQVKYEIVKISDAEGLEFKAQFIKFPEIKLGDFSKIKVKKEEVKITDKEVDEETKKIVEYYQQLQDKSDKKEDKKKEELKIDDALVKSLNIGFDSLDKFKEQIKVELEVAKKRDGEIKWLQDVLQEAIKLSKIKVPQAIIKQGLKQREHDYLKKLDELKLKLDDFLKMQNTSMEKLRKEWEKEETQKYSEELLLLEIIKQEKITVTEEEIQAELERVNDEKTIQQLSTDEGRRYLVTVILQQKALTWLRNKVNK